MAKEALQLEFANGEYDFRLTLKGINEIQEKCGCGIGKVWSRLAASRFDMIPGDAETNVGVPNVADFRMEDVIEPIRQGLIGGGKGTVDGEPVTVTNAMANRLIENYVLDAPLAESWKIAFFLMNALIEGYDPPKKKVEPDAESETTTDDSTTQEPLPTA